MTNNLSQSREYCLALEQLLSRPSNPKLGLERIKILLERIGFERRSLRIIHVVGTNGKGSTVAFVESILRAHQISCGLFTSPHLCTARERIRINGIDISEADFVDAATHVLREARAMSDDEPSFFECVLAMALLAMQKRSVHVAILEAGLGGRLDATTAVMADVLGVTAIDFDHQNILGSTLAEIATEKLSAARRGQTVLSVSQNEEALLAMTALADEIGVELKFTTPCPLALGLYGEHQRINAGLAVALARELYPDLPESVIALGLMSVTWPGRFEIIDNAISLVLDGAHNPAGLRSLMHALKHHDQFRDRPLILVYGSLGGPNVDDKIAALNAACLPLTRVYVHEPKNLRAVSEAELCDALRNGGIDENLLRPFVVMSEVIDDATRNNAAIVVCGSLYTVGEIRAQLLGIVMDHKEPNF